MKSIIDGNFRVAPFEFDSIRELRIERNINEHATLYVQGTVNSGWEDMPVMDSTECTNIKCEDDGNVYFSGVLQDISVTYVDDVYHLEAHAISHTIKLDTDRHKRAFQDTGWTYKDIVEAIITEGGGAVNFHAEAEPVNRILVQYAETDWQFAKRLASHTQDVLTAISTSDEPEFRFGVEDSGFAGMIEEAMFSVHRDFNLLRSRANDKQPLAEGSITMYRVTTDDFPDGMYEVGEKVRLNGRELRVRHAVLSLEQSMINCTYTLASESALTAPTAYNSNIMGLALPGTVQVVEDDNVKLNLDIDYRHGTVQFFKYATSYSPESHTGWYVMPEVGDTVFLIFPTEDERDAHASTSKRRSGTSRTCNPLVKYLRTTFGKEIMLQEKEVLITAKDDETYIRLNEDTGIEIYSLKPIKIFSDQTLDITSTEDMSITTEANLAITANESITMTCGENVIKIEPPTGIAVNTDQEINVSSMNDTNVNSDTKMTINSGNDMSISTDANLAVTAKDSIEAVCAGNSVNIKPATGIAAATDQEVKISSDGNTSIDSKAELTVTSADDMNLSSASKFVANGEAKAELIGESSTAMLDASGIDLKGTEIRLN